MSPRKMLKNENAFARRKTQKKAKMSRWNRSRTATPAERRNNRKYRDSLIQRRSDVFSQCGG
jgi:hypothetical protein